MVLVGMMLLSTSIAKRHLRVTERTKTESKRTVVKGKSKQKEEESATQRKRVNQQQREIQ